MKPFELTATGTVLVSFTALEAGLINDLAVQVVELLGGNTAQPQDRMFATIGIGGGDAPSSDPAIARLLPDAYRDDRDASQEFRRLTEHSLSDRKIANARELVRMLGAGGGAGSDEIELDADAQQAWLRALNDIRLIIASRIGIEGDGDEGRGDSDADLIIRDVYDWLGMVQGSLVEVLE